MPASSRFWDGLLTAAPQELQRRPTEAHGQAAIRTAPSPRSCRGVASVAPILGRARFRGLEPVSSDLATRTEQERALRLPGSGSRSWPHPGHPAPVLGRTGNLSPGSQPPAPRPDELSSGGTAGVGAKGESGRRGPWSGRPRGGSRCGARRPRVPCRAGSQAEQQASNVPAATYQGPSLVLTIPGGRPLFGPAGHFTLQDRNGRV